MTSLIACLGEDKGTVAHVAGLIQKEEWDHIFIITEKKPENFPTKSNIEFIIVNSSNILPNLAEELKDILKTKITDIEVAINIISGTGKIHMATLSALLKLGLGIRLVTLTQQGVKEV